MSSTSPAGIRFEVSPEVGEVSGLLLRPAHASVLLVLGHGAGAGMRHRFMEGIAGALAACGVATLRYQFPYAEAGRRRPDRTPALVATVRAAVEAAVRLAPDLPAVAGGKSMGGRMTSTAQAEAPLTPIHGLVFFGFPLHRPGDPSDARGDHLTRVALPMLFVQGTRDRLAEQERVERLRARLGDRATLHLVVDADHGFDVLKRTGRSAADVYAQMASRVRGWTDSLPV